MSYGPVPAQWSASQSCACGSPCSCSFTSVGLTIFSPYGEASQLSNGSMGVFSWTTRVVSSGALVLTIGATMYAGPASTSRRRSIENRAASALKGVPSANFTSGTKWNVHVLPSDETS